MDFCDRCSEKKLTHRFHSCYPLSTNPPNFNACLTVNEVTIARKGKSMQDAKDNAAIAMVDHLNGKSVDFGYQTLRGYKNMTNHPMAKEMSDPAYRLQYL